MEIKDLRKDAEVDFSTLEAGDVFEWDGNLYCRLNKKYSKYNAIDLIHFTLLPFSRADKIKRVNATLTIKD